MIQEGNICLGSCQPKQILNINQAMNSISELEVYNNCSETYDLETLEYAYSTDLVCWSCYISWTELIKLTDDIESDFYIRVKIQGPISKVILNEEETFNYTTCLDSEFHFECTSNSNTWQPYNNMECAIALQQQLAETVACMFGIPIYYFKLAGNRGSQDLTFKEYTLMDVQSVKQIKLMVSDGQMPSSKPTFSEMGFDWETDWETEITKGMFATAFGVNAQPTEGDLIYIPMMKRMWMVNEAYEEKRDGLMWQATSFKVMLVKYEEKGSVNLGETEELINTFVKNKYEELFGTDENIDAGVETLDSPQHAANNLYPVYESDATRKYVTCFNTEIRNVSTYHKGTLISEYCYDFSQGADDTMVLYQHKYCGEDGTLSVIINPLYGDYDGTLISIGNININIKQEKDVTTIYMKSIPEMLLELESNNRYFIYIRWSRQLNIIEMSAVKYSYPERIPLYKLQNHMYFYDIDHTKRVTSKWSIELSQEVARDVSIGKIYGTITNFKLFDVYINNLSEILMMYPNDKHLTINDTARKLVDLPGISIK